MTLASRWPMAPLSMPSMSRPARLIRAHAALFVNHQQADGHLLDDAFIQGGQVIQFRLAGRGQRRAGAGLAGEGAGGQRGQEETARPRMPVCTQAADPSA